MGNISILYYPLSTLWNMLPDLKTS